jgi:hypothetical protein
MGKERNQLYEPLSHDDNHSSQFINSNETQTHKTPTYFHRGSKKPNRYLPRLLRAIEIVVVVASLAFGSYAFVWFDKPSSDHTCPMQPFFRPGTFALNTKSRP